MILENEFVHLLGYELNELRQVQIFNDFSKEIQVNQIVDNYFIVNKTQGIDFIFDKNKKLVSIHFRSKDNNDGYTAFSQNMPCNLSFFDTAESAHQKIGLPEFTHGGGQNTGLLGVIQKWRKYSFANCYLSIRFNENDFSSMITIGI